MKLSRIATVFAAATLASFASAATFDMDPQHSSAGFKVRHLMISNVKGEFSKVKGSVDFDPSNPASAHIDAVIDVTTINTGEAQRDTHLKSPDFFDVAKYPTIVFKSKKVTRVAGTKYKALGDLTIHGVTKEVTLDVEATSEVKDPWGNMRFGANATTKINRKDFGLIWNKALETGGVMVGDDVDITIDVELVKKGAAKATD
jgi:polyisoprenoid-binding protein YceI